MYVNQEKGLIDLFLKPVLKNVFLLIWCMLLFNQHILYYENILAEKMHEGFFFYFLYLQ